MPFPGRFHPGYRAYLILNSHTPDMRYRIYKALLKPKMYFGVQGIAIVIELLIAMFLGLFVSWFYIFIVVVMHITLMILFRTNTFLIYVLPLSVLKMNIKSDFMGDEK